MKRRAQIALIGVVLLAVASWAAAQGTLQVPTGTPQPTLRFGNFIEVGNDILMHIIASSEFVYNTSENFDFERKVRERVSARGDTDTSPNRSGSDTFWMQSRFGADFRYQKSTELQLVLQQVTTLDGNTTDDRMNSTNPGGTDVFGRAAVTENKGFFCVFCWLDYKFEGTPLRLRVGYDLWRVDQAGLIGDNDPRLAVFGDFGDFDVMGAAVYQYESQRLGLTNDNDLVYYTFSAGYNLRPHRFQLDVIYTRDRFAGADVASPRTVSPSTNFGFQGQKNDSVLVSVSASGRLGIVRAMAQGMVVLGHAKGANAGGIAQAGLAGVRGPDRDYDIFAGGVVAYGEADLGMVRPFVGFIWGSADGDPTDHKLHGFNPQSFGTTTQLTGTTWFSHLDTSNALSSRDYACPGRFQGLGVNPATPGVNPAAGANPGAPGIAGRSGPLVPASDPTQVIAGQQNPYATGIRGTTAQPSGGFAECAHTVTNPYNDRLGTLGHPGLLSAYSNPGTLLIPAGVRVFPLKGYEINAWYIYKAMVNTKLLEAAFAPELQVRGGGIRKAQYNEIGGAVLWTINPNFDIRAAGNVAFAGGGSLDLAHLGNCNTGGGGAYGSSARCGGKDAALRGEVRFRARF